MTNNEIIAATVRATYSPEQLAELAKATDTPEQLAADLFHTFAEWKRMGYSVKKGEHAALVCNLWKYTDKPGKAAREAAAEAGENAPETDPHFYMARAYLFHALQVERSKR